MDRGWNWRSRRVFGFESQSVYRLAWLLALLFLLWKMQEPTPFEQSPPLWTNGYSASSEISLIVWTWKFITLFTRVGHLSLPWTRSIYFTSSQPIWDPYLYCLIYAEVFHLVSFPSGFPTILLRAFRFFPHVLRAPVFLILLYLVILCWWRVQIKKLLNMRSPLVPCYLLPLKPTYILQHAVLDTLSAYVLLSIWETQVSQAWKMGQIIVMCISIFIFLENVGHSRK
jgi:hypothetical protein